MRAACDFVHYLTSKPSFVEKERARILGSNGPSVNRRSTNA
jgi:hypothetical protein